MATTSAVGLMIGGIALLDAVTATLASWLIEKVAQETTSTRSGDPNEVGRGARAVDPELTDRLDTEPPPALVHLSLVP